jgi:uncharacterized protein YecT (DUF1311 family)
MRPSFLLLALLGLLAVACSPGPAVTLAPEAAVQACEGPTALALRAQATGFRSLTLEPAASSRVERRATMVGRERLGMVVAGHGVARLADGARNLRYLCLLGRRGEPLFVDVETSEAADLLAACRAQAPGRVPACLGPQLGHAEAALAEAEAGAIRRAHSGDRLARDELDQPAAISIGAWRVYRDAECARQAEALAGVGSEIATACLIELTRQRVRELTG